MRTEFLCVLVLRVASGPRVKLASCKSVLGLCGTPWTFSYLFYFIFLTPGGLFY